MKKAIFFLLSSLILLVDCRDIQSCTNNPEQPFMILRFYNFSDQSAKKVGFRVSAATSTGLFALSDDSLAIGLPLDPQDTSVLFLFDSDTTDYELSVRYGTQFSIFDPECEPSILFAGIDTLRSTFDSTAIVGTVTNRQLPTNIEVYF